MENLQITITMELGPQTTAVIQELSHSLALHQVLKSAEAKLNRPVDLGLVTLTPASASTAASPGDKPAGATTAAASPCDSSALPLGSAKKPAGATAAASSPSAAPSAGPSAGTTLTEARAAIEATRVRLLGAGYAEDESKARLNKQITSECSRIVTQASGGRTKRLPELKAEELKAFVAELAGFAVENGNLTVKTPF